MHFYGLSFEELRSIPARTFWALSRNIDRLRSEIDMRQLILLSQIIGGEPKKYYETLKGSMGQVVIGADEKSEELDRTGLDRLRLMLST